LQHGAHNYLVKEDVTPVSLQRALDFAVTRFQMEEQLRQSKEKFQQLAAHLRFAADAAELGFWSWNAETNHIQADQNNRRMLGLPLAGALSFEMFLGTVLEDDCPGLQSAIEKCLQTGTSYDEEFRVKTADGSIRWIAARGSAIRGRKELTTGMTGIALDVTERKNLQEDLLASKKRLRMALNSARMSTWDWDLATDTIDWSENLEPQMAMPKGSFQGGYAAFLELVHPEDRQMVAQSVARALQEGVDYHIEFRMLRADGGVRWTETRGSVSLDEAGKPVRMMGVDTDITERKQKEEELQRSERRSRQLIDSNLIPIICANAEYITDANNAFLQMLGYTREEFFTSPINWRSLTPPEYLPGDMEALEQLEIRGFCPPFEKEYIRRDGSRVPILIGATTLSSSPPEYLCFILNLSDLKRVESELRKSQQELEQKIAERTAELVLSLASVDAEIRVRNETEQHLRDLSARLLRLQDEERRRIARDLQDSTGQTLSALKLSLAQLEEQLRGNSGVSGLLEDLRALADQAVGEIRTTSYVLHPPLLDEVGFSCAAGWHVDGFTKRTGIRATLDLSQAPKLNPEVELAFYRVLQESMINVLRHSASPSVEVRLYSENESAVLSIRDLGGQLRVESDGSGTAVFARLPLEKSVIAAPHRFSEPSATRGAAG